MILWALSLSAALAGAGAAAPVERGGAPAADAAAAPEILLYPFFRATGVRDAPTAATAIHCTNFGTGSRTLFVSIDEFDGTLDCSMSVAVAAGETRTLATRSTAFFVEDATCADAPLTSQGALLIASTSPERLICTVLLLDPAGTTPEFLDRLSLLDRNGVPLAWVLFADGFETGDVAAWT